MQQQYKIICFFLLFISKHLVESTTTTTITTTPTPEWPGDPKICTVNTPTTTTSSGTSTPSPPPSLPVFNTQTEYGVEAIITRYQMDALVLHELVISHYVYDYDNNRLVILENRNGTYDSKFYDYSQLRESIYYAASGTCEAKEIPQNDPTNGRSAIDLGNNNWHIRRLNEFLLFSSNDPNRPVRVTYLGRSSIRQIPVNTWESCHVNPALKRTERVLWSFAVRGTTMPSGTTGPIDIAVQATINSSVVDDDDVQLTKQDTVLNVLFYRPSLIKTFNPISPPKAVHCNNVREDQLVTLANVSVNWPRRFDVRVEVSTSRSSQWQRFHLFYQRGETDLTGRLRYDFLPAGAEDFKSVIHDYSDNITYAIDRRLGTCEFKQGVEYSDVDPLHNPIEFFLKNEEYFILKPPENAWEVKGSRQCRTGSIECAIFLTQRKNFPDIIEPDTCVPTGDTWEYTSIEYAWSKRSLDTHLPFNRTPSYDYPVSLYLKMFRNNHSEDIEYEFYEMSHDSTINRFDISTCYRSFDYDYLHLVLTLKLSRGEIIDSNHLNRQLLDLEIHYQLVNRMQIRYSRLTNLEIDHETLNNVITVFFTLLGQTLKPDSAKGYDDREPTAAQARDTLQEAVDNNKFAFQIRLRDQSEVEFRAEPNSLKSSKQFTSSHSASQQIIVESYTAGSQALAITVGSLAGLLAGVLLAAILRFIRKDPMPNLPGSFQGPMTTIGLNANKTTEATSDA